MHRRDRIDPILAKHFAWTFVVPGDTVRLAETVRAAERAASSAAGDAPAAQTSALEPAREDDRSAERSRSKSKAGCRALATAIAEAWRDSGEAVRPTEVGLQVAKRLLSRADRLGVELLEMRNWPVEAVRLLRILVRHAPRMGRRLRERGASVATLLPLEHPEAAELLVEVARAGDRVMADALLADEEWTPKVQDESSLVARLADVVDAGAGHASRVIAIEFIERFDRRTAAIASLKRALELPSFAVRARALHALATAKPCALGRDNLVQVLRDLVTHAVPETMSSDEHEENERTFAEAVIVALEHAGSDEAAEALLDWIDAERDALWLDAGWATEALAVGFAETAAAMVDHWLRCARAYDRTKALAALARFSDELARPRLELAASDPSPLVREAARQQWLDRFGAACPVNVEALVGAALLDGPPTERFASRLLVIGGRVPEARQAMARALLAEEPNREGLVALLQFVGDDSVSAEPLALDHTVEGEGDSDRAGPASGAGGKVVDWAKTLVERFGELGIQGLCALAARFPEPESFGWMRRLGDLVDAGFVPPAMFGPLRSLAARHVAADNAGVTDDALRLLALVGAPAELLDRALGLALDVDLGSPAAHDLIVGWPDRTVDSRLASQMALAVAERDWARVQRAASLAFSRGSHAARVIAQRVLEVAEIDEAAVDAAVECARRLRDLGTLDDDWARAALARPDSPIFAVAARLWRKSSAVRPALEAALASPSRGGASRAEAAIALLWGDPPLSPRDRRLAGVLGASPPQERAELVHVMCMRGAPLTHVAAHLQELLTSQERSITQPLVGVSPLLRTAKGQALLRAVLPRVVDPDLRADIEQELGASEAPYWVEG